MGDCLDQNGKELPHAPRSILKRQLARARDMGYTVKIGTELEFYAFDESFDSVQQKRYRDLKTAGRSEEHTSELQSLMRNSSAVFCFKKKNTNKSTTEIFRDI